VCQALGAVGHAKRAQLLGKLLDGPATYRALQRVTRLKPGPLYHHVNQLRLAGLILPKQRDLYELTRGGRNLILAVMAVAPLIRDPRRRPLPEGV
jgi:predicted transcriptional regulator